MSNLIHDLIREGTSNLVQKQKEQEKTKMGILRGGNSGLYDGTIVAGTCARLAYLRTHGIDVKDGEDHSKELMFDAGRGNEDLVKVVLQASGWKGKILAEEEVPTCWHTSNGTPVTGRPDLVLQDEGGKLIHGLELKLVSSMWTARDVFEKPKLPHIAQATHYSHALGIPFTIVYVSRVNFAVLGFAQKLFPKFGEYNSEHCVYNEKEQIKGTLPFIKTYPLQTLENGDVQYYARDAWYASAASVPRLLNFYQLVDDMTYRGVVAPPPMNLDAHGEEAKSWSLCDYCELKEVCVGKKFDDANQFKKEVLEYVETKK